MVVVRLALRREFSLPILLKDVLANTVHGLFCLHFGLLWIMLSFFTDMMKPILMFIGLSLPSIVMAIGLIAR